MIRLSDRVSELKSSQRSPPSDLTILNTTTGSRPPRFSDGYEQLQSCSSVFHGSIPSRRNPSQRLPAKASARLLWRLPCATDSTQSVRRSPSSSGRAWRTGVTTGASNLLSMTDSKSVPLPPPRVARTLSQKPPTSIKGVCFAGTSNFVKL